MNTQNRDDRIKDILMGVGLEIAKANFDNVMEEMKKVDYLKDVFVHLAINEIEHAFASGVVNGVIKGYRLAREFTDDQVIEDGAGFVPFWKKD